MSKRYVLLMADGEVTEEDRKTLDRILEGRYGKVKVIPVASNPRAVIVKTTNSVAPLLRDSGGQITLGGKPLTTLLTSGSIGKLKKRAAESRATENGKVP